jgi:hypothetical protein
MARFPQKSWSAGGSTKEKTAERPLFFRCFPLFCEKLQQSRRWLYPGNRFSASFGEIRMHATISYGLVPVNLTHRCGSLRSARQRHWDVRGLAFRVVDGASVRVK